MDDDELARVLRGGLERRADRAEVDHGLVTRATADARGRRTKRRWAVLGAAAAVVTVVGVTVLVAGLDESPPGDIPSASASDEARPSGTRTEHWGDIELEVPAWWGYGAAPAGPVDAAVTCGPGALRTAGGATVDEQERETLPYVGRPVALSDDCVGYQEGAAPTAGPTDYVWLGASVAPGSVKLPGGSVQQTVVRAGVTVTVASPDPAVRERILASVGGGEKCLSRIDHRGPIAHDPTADPSAEPVTLRVCAYRGSTEAPYDWTLTYVRDLGRGPLEEYLAAVAAGERPRDQCPTIDYQLTEAVVLELLDADGGVLRQDAVNPFASCAGVAVGASSVWPLETTRLTRAMTEPWVGGGVAAVVLGDPALGFASARGG